jgi:hypothetical protein
MPSETKKPAMSSLEQLKATGTFIVADSGDFEVSVVFKDQMRRIVPLISLCSTCQREKV